MEKQESLLSDMYQFSLPVLVKKKMKQRKVRRLCNLCMKPLSIWNPNKICQSHNATVIETFETR